MQMKNVEYKWTVQDIPSQPGRVASVNGATSRVGFYTAEELARKRAAVAEAVPGSKISGGKIIGKGRMPTNNRATTILNCRHRTPTSTPKTFLKREKATAKIHNRP